jgi:hypothetical protein
MEGRTAGALIGPENRDEDESSRVGSIPTPSAYKRWGQILQSLGRESGKGSPANGAVAKR